MSKTDANPLTAGPDDSLSLPEWTEAFLENRGEQHRLDRKAQLIGKFQRIYAAAQRDMRERASKLCDDLGDDYYARKIRELPLKRRLK